MVEPSHDRIETAAAMPALRATAIVGLGSVATLAMSVLTMKAYALLVGPAGVGLLALMQSIVNLGVVITGLGVATSAIGALAAAIGRGDRNRAGVIERAATAIGCASGLIGAVLLIAGRGLLSDLALGDPSRTVDIALLAPALLFATAASIQLALLTGQHRIRAVTVVNVGTSVAAAGFGIPLVVLIGEDGLAPAVLVTSVVQLTLSLAARRRHPTGTPPSTARVLEMSRTLLRRGLPVAGSQLGSQAAAFLIPLIVLQALSPAEVGLYRAAAALSIGYLAFFVAGLTQDYLPKLSAARNDVELGLLIERRMRLVMGMGVPVIFGLLATGPWLVEWLYSSEFIAAFEVLQWQLVGDLLRLPAWVLLFVLLARHSGRIFLSVELLAGAALIVATSVGLAVLGLEGAGVGYLVSQAIYFGVLWLVVRRRVPTTPGRLQAVLIALAALCALVLLVELDPLTRLLVFGATAGGLAVVAWPRLYRLHRGGEL